MTTLLLISHYRRTLARASNSINLRSACSGALVVGQLPLRGLDDSQLEHVRLVADASTNETCPQVTQDEAATLEYATWGLREVADLEGTLDRFVVWLARGVALHEARHLADGASIECPNCPQHLTRAAQRELSAFVATLAWSTTPLTSLLHACMSTQAGQDAHAQALNTVLTALGTSCQQPAPEELQRRARALEQYMFGDTRFAVEAAVEFGTEPCALLDK